MKIQGKIFTISNFLSFSRVLIVIPILLLLQSGTETHRWYAFYLMLIGASTDFLDGYLARTLNQQSDLGRIIDPIADKIGIGLIAIILTQTSGLPIWFLVLIIARDLVILLLGSQIVNKEDKIPESNWYGKIAVSALALVVLFYTLQVPVWKEVMMYISIVMLALSMQSYTVRYIQFLRNQKAVSK